MVFLTVAAKGAFQAVTGLQPVSACSELEMSPCPSRTLHPSPCSPAPSNRTKEAVPPPGATRGSASECRSKEYITRQPYSLGELQDGTGKFLLTLGTRSTNYHGAAGEGRETGREKLCVCTGLRPASYHRLSGMNCKATREFSQAQLHLHKARRTKPSDWEGALLQTLWLFCLLHLMPSLSFCEWNSGNTCSRLVYFKAFFFLWWCAVKINATLGFFCGKRFFLSYHTFSAGAVFKQVCANTHTWATVGVGQPKSGKISEADLQRGGVLKSFQDAGRTKLEGLLILPP